MRRFWLATLVALLLLSLAANAILGWAAWRAQGEYRALSKQFVKARQDLAAATKAASNTPAATPPAKSAPPPAAPATGSAPATAPAPAPAAPTAPSPTEAAIRERYTPRLLAVQSQCEAQLGTLLTAAKAEYAQAKAGGAKVDVAALGAKYLAQADGLRRQCDRQVDAITRDMSADLRAAGLSQDLVTEVREAYEARIVERQAEIMAKAPGN